MMLQLCDKVISADLSDLNNTWVAQKRGTGTPTFLAEGGGVLAY